MITKEIPISSLMNYLIANEDDIAEALETSDVQISRTILDIQDCLDELDEITQLMYSFTLKRLHRRAK